MKAKMQKFWHLEKMPPLSIPTQKAKEIPPADSPACTSLRLMSEQAGGNGERERKGGREGERDRTISPLGKAQLTEPSCFLLAVDSAETTAAEFIMVIFKGPTDRIARPTCQTHSLARPDTVSRATFLYLANALPRGERFALYERAFWAFDCLSR